MDKIMLRNMHFYGNHGVFAEEKAHAQPFHVDVELFADLKKASVSDELTDTVDYAAVYNLVKSAVEQQCFNLIERMAGFMADSIMENCTKIQRVVVRVRKPQVLLGGPLDAAEVELERCRSDR